MMTEEHFDTHRFDESLRQKLDGFEVTPREDSWNKVSSRLQTTPTSRFTVSFRKQVIRYAAAAAVIAATLTVSLWKTFQKFEQSQTTVAGTQNNTETPVTHTAETLRPEEGASPQLAGKTPSSTPAANRNNKEEVQPISLQEDNATQQAANDNYTPSSEINTEIPAIPVKILRQEPDQPLENIEVIEKKVDPKKRKGKK